MLLCPIQEECPQFNNGTKRKVHHIRISEPCKGWLDMTCEMGINLRLWLEPDQPIACNLDKIKKIKEKK